MSQQPPSGGGGGGGGGSNSVDDETLKCIVDIIWEDYDADNSGEIDKAECKMFIKQCLQNFGSKKELTDGAFNEIFATYDTDGSGTIDKSEMTTVIRNILDGP